MKRYIPVVASLMAFSLIACGEVMDLTQPEKAEVMLFFYYWFHKKEHDTSLTSYLS